MFLIRLKLQDYLHLFLVVISSFRHLEKDGKQKTIINMICCSILFY